jgi:hypothetical protein
MGVKLLKPDVGGWVIGLTKSVIHQDDRMVCSVGAK